MQSIIDKNRSMHEMSLLEDVLQIIEDNAQHQGFKQVKHVWLEIGALSCVEPEALRFAFDVVMQHSLVEGAVLDIIEVQGQAQCPACGQSVKATSRHECCSNCGQFGLHITRGTEMRVKELEVL